MLRNASSIIGNSVKATDGAIGSIDDMFFDDEQWILRWLVVDTGTWLPGRRVLLPPHVCGIPDAVRDQVPVNLDREQIKASPPADADGPVSRQTEADLYAHYGWDPYWGAGSGYPGAPLDFAPDLKKSQAFEETGGRATREDAHLRSINSVRNHAIQAMDGEIGHAEDFLIDDTDWRIAYLVIDTQDWWPGKRVLLSPRWLDEVSWSQRKIFARQRSDKEQPGLSCGQ